MINPIVYSAVGDTFLFIIAIIILLGLTYFLFKQIVKEMIKNKEERNLLIEGVISKSEMNSIIAMYMNRMGEGAKFGLIYIDLDKFEDFVMAFGKKGANNILKNVANKIKAILPRNAYISNYKGDEFLIFLPQEYDRSEILLYAKNLLNSFRKQTEVMGSELIDLTASIAVAYYPQHGNSIKNLLQSLNLAIYKVKKTGGNAFKIYSSDLIEDEEHLEYYYQIKKAIENKEFSFHYQPIYDITNKTVYAFEALLRWNHPEHGIISPYKFINILEQSGDIHWVGTWGFDELVKNHLQLRRRSSKYLPMLSINLSPKQLMGENLIKDFSAILRKYKVTASNFILEIGEFALFDRQQVIIDNITKLKKLGFKVAIDGFGIDMATFEKLQVLDVDIVKVEYSFLEEESFVVDKHMEILQQFTEGRRKVIVQGIEDENGEKRINSYKIALAQGYFYSKPVNYDEMLVLNAKNIDRLNK